MENIAEKKRVVVTGISMVSSIGIGVDEYWQSVLQSKSGIGLVTRFDTSNFRCKVGGEVHNYDVRRYFEDVQSGISFDRSAGFALGAIKMAIADAGYRISDLQEAGCYVGIAIGGAEYGEIAYHDYMKEGETYFNPNIYHGNIPNGCMAFINKYFGFRGPCHTLSTGCTSSTDTFGFAFKAIKSGQASVMVTGGTDAPITPLTYAAFGNIRALTPNVKDPEKSSRPFDKNRDGFVPSEGSCFFVLESLDSALARNARIYAEVLGFGCSSNAYHMVHPSPDGVQNIKAIRMALDEAGLEPEQISYVNAHGSSTKLNDSSETKIIKEVFGEHAYKIKISSTKSMVGHMLGATGAIEIATTSLGLYHAVVPPTINYETPDPECDLDYTPNHPVNMEYKYAISNATGFGGLNSVIVLSKYGK